MMYIIAFPPMFLTYQLNQLSQHADELTPVEMLILLATAIWLLVFCIYIVWSER